MDVQAVKLALYNRASTMFYNTKLSFISLPYLTRLLQKFVDIYGTKQIASESLVFATMTLDYLNHIVENTPASSNISLVNDG